MKITSLNVNGFRGCYKEAPITTKNMERVKDYIQVNNLLEEKDDIVIFYEIPYAIEGSKPYNEFIRIFGDYGIIKPKHLQSYAEQCTIALVNKESNWKRAEQEKFKYTPKFDYGNKVLELQNKNISILGLHMNTDNAMWECLGNTLDAQNNIRYTFIVGDLNAHDNEHRPDDRRSLEKLKMIQEHWYSDLVPKDYVTYYPVMTTVDHFFYDNKQLTDKYREIEFRVLPINLSDHASLLFETKTI